MDFEPQKLFIGLIDFFSVLLPGAVLTYLLSDDVGPYLLGASYSKISGTEGWALFLLSSYLVGHFIFLLGSQLDELYDAIRRAGYRDQITRLAAGNSLSA